MSKTQLPLQDLDAIIPALNSGAISSVEIVSACLKHIKAHDKDIHAWAHVDETYVLGQAEEADNLRRRGKSLGSLHGIPVGIKDTINTADMPTEYGCSRYKGYRPQHDATVIHRLKEAGAIIFGKTHTCEMAYLHPTITQNPHNLAHTPGGSSSGSAAAVAAGMIPISLGTQTNGSVIRPASFCGSFAYKPSHDHISCHGILRPCLSLDVPGVFARSLADLARVGDTLSGYDPRDPVMRRRTPLNLSDALASEPPFTPRFAFVRTPMWPKLEDTTKDLLRHTLEQIPAEIDLVTLPDPFNSGHHHHRTIMEAELAHVYAPMLTKRAGDISEDLQNIMHRGGKVLAKDYLAARDAQKTLRAILSSMMEDYDAILTPATLGEAPAGLSTTGDPGCCTLWSLCGVPALSIPVMRGPNNLPIGLQCVSSYGNDARLFRAAAWLCGHLNHEICLTHQNL